MNIFLVLLALAVVAFMGGHNDTVVEQMLSRADVSQIRGQLVLTSADVRQFSVQGVEGTLPQPGASFNGDGPLNEMVTLYADRVRPVLVRATCTLWDLLEDEAVLGDDGLPSEEECWPMGTGFAYKAEGGKTYWATAAHVVEDGFAPFFLWYGYKVEKHEFFIGSPDIPAALIKTDGKQSALVTEGELGITPVPTGSVGGLGVGVEVFSLGLTRFRDTDKTYYYRFANHGQIVGMTIDFPDADVHTTLGAVAGESGSPVFALQDGVLSWIATVETGWHDSHKSGVVLLRRGIVEAVAGDVATSRVGELPSVEVPRWENWDKLETEQQALWVRLRAEDTKYYYQASLGVPGWVFLAEGYKIVIAETKKFERDFIDNAFPAVGKLSDWDTLLPTWELMDIIAAGGDER